MQHQPLITLSDGNTIPQVGLGVWRADDKQAAQAVETAINAGYRHIDTAAIYGNETGVGDGIHAAGIDRKSLFVTTKLWNGEQGYETTLRAFDESLKKLRLDYIDLYLIHWPVPKRDTYVDTWKAFIELQKQGRIRSIGVSNFEVSHLDRIIAETGVVPVINQIETHPAFQQTTLREQLLTKHIQSQSWSPLGQGPLLENPLIADIAKKHQRTAAQVVIRWHIQNKLVVIPKSVTPSRIVENFNVFDFELDADDLARIATLDRKDGRLGPVPDEMDMV
jgi:2,5-diketo-D-gluconate reductase A